VGYGVVRNRCKYNMYTYICMSHVQVVNVNLFEKNFLERYTPGNVQLNVTYATVPAYVNLSTQVKIFKLVLYKYDAVLNVYEVPFLGM
jgi:hypothetical protein